LAARLEDKIKGMFIGLTIGDALGMPVETFSCDRIKNDFPEGIRDYVSADGHKWFDGIEPGSWTDDTQLSLAVAEALIESKGFSMDAIAKHHIEAFKKDTRGWGATTREAIQRLRDQTHWSKSASESTAKKVRGVGNGVPMKISPLGAYHFLNKTPWQRAVAEIAVFTQMTHNTSMAISSALAQSYAVQYCLERTDNFDKKEFVEVVISQSKKAEVILPVHHGQDNISKRFEQLQKWGEYTDRGIVESFGGGSCYVFNSLPFTYAFFLKYDCSLDSLFSVVESGGDTDTNGSMVGALLGALHGFDVFPEGLVDKLAENQVILDMAAKFAATFFGGKKHE